MWTRVNAPPNRNASNHSTSVTGAIYCIKHTGRGNACQTRLISSKNGACWANQLTCRAQLPARTTMNRPDLVPDTRKKNCGAQITTRFKTPTFQVLIKNGHRPIASQFGHRKKYFGTGLLSVASRRVIFPIQQCNPKGTVLGQRRKAPAPIPPRSDKNAP